MCIMCIKIMLKYHPGCAFFTAGEPLNALTEAKTHHVFVWFLTPLQANVNDYRRSECSKLLMHWDDRGLYEEHGGHRQRMCSMMGGNSGGFIYAQPADWWIDSGDFCQNGLICLCLDPWHAPMLSRCMNGHVHTQRNVTHVISSYECAICVCICADNKH